MINMLGRGRRRWNLILLKRRSGGMRGGLRLVSLILILLRRKMSLGIFVMCRWWSRRSFSPIVLINVSRPISINGTKPTSTKITLINRTKRTWINRTTLILIIGTNIAFIVTSTGNQDIPSDSQDDQTKAQILNKSSKSPNIEKALIRKSNQSNMIRLIWIRLRLTEMI
jgi:hypothetical protein